MIATQLPLALQINDAASFDNFFIGDNTELAECLKSARRAAYDGEQIIFFWGNPSSGKTHLLHASCRHAIAQGQTASYLSLKHNASLKIEVFNHLEKLSLICIDDFQSIAGNPIWEQALFHLYNRVRDADCQLLIASSESLANLSIALADLKSRLAWGLVFRLHDLSDADKIAALRLRAKVRGFELSEKVGEFLLRRFPRDMNSLFALLDELDIATLSAQRKLTIPFIKHWMSQR